MSGDATFLGRGWAFPPAFSAGGADVAMVSEDADIQQSLRILLGTAPGERVMQEAFGCGLERFAFESLSQSMIRSVRALISDAILYFEPRIALESVDCAPDPDQPGLLLISVDYRVRATNSRFNLVYPYYLDQAAAGDV